MNMMCSAVDAAIQAIADDRLRGILRHWQAASGERRMPAWRDIDPLAIGPCLHLVWSWKYDRAEDSFTGRLAGEEIKDNLGQSIRNRKLAEVFGAPAYDDISRLYRRVVTAPCIALGKGPVFTRLEKHGIGERLIMPLAEDGIIGDGVLGATVYRLIETDAVEPHDAGHEQMLHFSLT